MPDLQDLAICIVTDDNKAQGQPGLLFIPCAAGKTMLRGLPQPFLPSPPLHRDKARVCFFPEHHQETRQGVGPGDLEGAFQPKAFDGSVIPRCSFKRHPEQQPPHQPLQAPFLLQPF